MLLNRSQSEAPREGGGTNPFCSPDGQSVGFVDWIEELRARVPVP